MHKLLWKIWFANQNLVYLVSFETGSLALLQNVLVYYSSVAVEWNDFKILLALSSSFQHTNILLGK